MIAGMGREGGREGGREHDRMWGGSERERERVSMIAESEGGRDGQR